MIELQRYDAFNPRRYSDPWVAIVDAAGTLDFSCRVGGYTGATGRGEAGVLYVTDPKDGAIYAYGQKDYRKNSSYEYVIYRDGQFVPVPKTELIAVLTGRSRTDLGDLQAELYNWVSAVIAAKEQPYKDAPEELLYKIENIIYKYFGD